MKTYPLQHTTRMTAGVFSRALFVVALLLICLSVDAYGQVTDDGKMIFREGDKVAFKADNGLYLQRVKRSHQGIEAFGTSVTKFNTFVILNMTRPGDLIEDGDEVALEADNGLYLQRVKRGQQGIEAFGSRITQYNTFVMLDAHKERFAGGNPRNSTDPHAIIDRRPLPNHNHR